MSFTRRLKPSHLDHIISDGYTGKLIYTAHNNQVTLRHSKTSQWYSITFGGRIVGMDVDFGESLLVIAYKKPSKVKLSGNRIRLLFNNKVYPANCDTSVLESDGVFGDHEYYSDTLHIECFELSYSDESPHIWDYHHCFMANVGHINLDKILCYRGRIIVMGFNKASSRHCVLSIPTAMSRQYNVYKDYVAVQNYGLINAQIIDGKLFCVGYDQSGVRGDDENTPVFATVYSLPELRLINSYQIKRFYTKEFLHIHRLSSTCIMLHDENQIGLFVFNPANYHMHLKQLYGSHNLKSIGVYDNYMVHSDEYGLSLFRFNDDYTISFETQLNSELKYHLGKYGYMESIELDHGEIRCVGLNNKYYNFRFSVETFCAEKTLEILTEKLTNYNAAFRDVGQHILAGYVE